MSFTRIIETNVGIAAPATAPAVIQNDIIPQIANLLGDDLLSWFWAEGERNAESLQWIRDAYTGEKWTAATSTVLTTANNASLNNKPTFTFPGSTWYSKALTLPPTGFGTIAVLKMPASSELRTVWGTPANQSNRLRMGDGSLNYQHEGVTGGTLGQSSATTTNQAVLVWTSWEPQAGVDDVTSGVNTTSSQGASGSFDSAPAAETVMQIGASAGVSGDVASGPWNGDIASVMFVNGPLVGTAALDARHASLLSIFADYYGITLT